MIWKLDFSEPATLITILFSAFVLLKKFGEMDRYHGLRVLILTLFFSCTLFLIFVSQSAFLDPAYGECDPELFCSTEM